ncbi:alpha/beta fold hydrolase [Candidatus Saccharibacteria bacterium]|nr:alpha/beta fold hydrolase [Candidatus Saccharibacteria bacterium]
MKLELHKAYDRRATRKPRITAVMIHGIASDATTYNALLEELERQEDLKDCRIVTFDLLGAGESPSGNELEYTYDEQLEALHNSIAKLESESPLVLVGHSLGTFIVTRYASIYPDEVSRLVLISPPIYTEQDFDNPAFILGVEAFKQAINARKPEVLDTKAFNNSMKNIVLDRKNYHTLMAIKIPVTIIYGDEDQLIASYNLPKLLNDNPQIQAIRVHGKHGVSQDKFEDIHKALKNERPITGRVRLYNTASRKIEKLKPISDVVKIYTCGPTVYAQAHIGNLTAYIYWDLLVRTLRAQGLAVKRVLNLTDVGHLVSDGDEGEDKLEKGAKREGKSVYEIADGYINLFKKDYRDLELSEPEVWARATDYIDADIAAVDLMTEHGYTYETKDGVYYDTSRFGRYAEFARLDLEGLQAGARVEFSGEKRNASDFAVWKFIQPGEKHAMRWDYLGRPGYPGWHLECATIIHKELGEPIDIHCGGIDHIPVHHTNEIAECYAAYGTELASTWLHCDFITIDGEKVSKSLGNTYTLDELSERGFSAMDFKMWVLSGHYRGTRNFTFDSLKAAKARRLNWRNRIAEAWQLLVEPEDGVIDRVMEALSNDLNSAEAFKVIDESNLIIDDWKKIDALFGLNLMADSPEIDDETRQLIRARGKARREKNYAEADRLRDLLAEKGISVKDTPDGPIWQYI